MSLVFGTVDAKGRLVDGYGCSVDSARTSNSGSYSIIFDDPFTDTPAVVCTLLNFGPQGQGSSTLSNVASTDVNQNGCTIKTVDKDGRLKDQCFSFIASNEGGSKKFLSGKVTKNGDSSNPEYFSVNHKSTGVYIVTTSKMEDNLLKSGGVVVKRYDDDDAVLENAVITEITQNSFTVVTGDKSGAPTNRQFCFVAAIADSSPDQNLYVYSGNNFTSHDSKLWTIREENQGYQSISWTTLGHFSGLPICLATSITTASPVSTLPNTICPLSTGEASWVTTGDKYGTSSLTTFSFLSVGRRQSPHTRRLDCSSGIVDEAGIPAVSGNSKSYMLDAGKEGVYLVAFSSPFLNSPSIVPTQEYPLAGNPDGTTVNNATIVRFSQSYAIIQTGHRQYSAARKFHWVAVDDLVENNSKVLWGASVSTKWEGNTLVPIFNRTNIEDIQIRDNGEYKVIFKQPYQYVPTVAAKQVFLSDGSGGWPADNAVVLQSATDHFHLKTGDGYGIGAHRDFCFVVGGWNDGAASNGFFPGRVAADRDSSLLGSFKASSTDQNTSRVEPRGAPPKAPLVVVTTPQIGRRAGAQASGTTLCNTTIVSTDKSSFVCQTEENGETSDRAYTFVLSEVRDRVHVDSAQ